MRQGLAVQLGMTPKSVQVWFQNRRQKLRARAAAAAAAAEYGEGGEEDDEDGDRFHPYPVDRARAYPMESPSPPPVPHAPRGQQAGGYGSHSRHGGYSFQGDDSRIMGLAQLSRAGSSLSSLSSLDTTRGGSSGTLDAESPGAHAIPGAQQSAACAAMMQELASITSAEHELTAFAQRLMRRKAELIESLQRMSAAPAIPQGLPASLPQGLQNAVLPRPPAPTFVSLQSIRMAMPHAEPTVQPGAAAPSHSGAMLPPGGLPHTGLPPATRDGAPASPPRGGAAVLTSAGFDTRLTPQKPFPPAGAMLAVEQSPSQADTCGAEAKAEYGGGGAASGLDLLSAALASAPALPTC